MLFEPFSQNDKEGSSSDFYRHHMTSRWGYLFVFYYLIMMLIGLEFLHQPRHVADVLYNNGDLSKNIIGSYTMNEENSPIL